jgi:hypothetical protein
MVSWLQLINALADTLYASNATIPRDGFVVVAIVWLNGIPTGDNQ